MQITKLDSEDELAIRAIARGLMRGVASAHNTGLIRLPYRMNHGVPENIEAGRADQIADEIINAFLYGIMSLDPNKG